MPRARWLLGPFALALATVAATRTPAFATPESKSAAEAAYAQGQKRYTEGDYLGAAARFKEAYGLDADPVYLFNAAQAYRFGKDCKAAADYYRQFLSAAPTTPNRAKVEEYIVEMDACVKAAEPVPVDPVPPTTNLAPSEPAVSDPGPAAEGGGSGTQRMVGIGVGVAGVVGIGVGIAYALKARSTQSEREGLCEPNPTGPCEWTPQDSDDEVRLDKQGKRQTRNARIALGAGSAALVVGIVLFALGGGDDEEEPELSIVPIADGAMVTRGFRF
ncbi:MAG: hypothetical protein H0T89_30775 [Deltaproteobacteria bacterium]|nr:hypothetical protein [Deltaproteobacteria bacterium]MDQ3295698.1 hypothetical protein [Myxococcota bacterium]